MIDQSEIEAVAARFGAPDSQIIRDHLISHVLAADELEVKVQLAQWRHGWQAIPLAGKAVQLRYSDLPEAVNLKVPTPSGFAAMKLMAWFDRHTPRDLYDIAALADAGHIDRVAVDLVKAIAGFTPNTATLERSVPRMVESSWQAELGHQLADASTAKQCLARVRIALDGPDPND